MQIFTAIMVNSNTYLTFRLLNPVGPVAGYHHIYHLLYFSTVFHAAGMEQQTSGKRQNINYSILDYSFYTLFFPISVKELNSMVHILEGIWIRIQRPVPDPN